MDTLELLATALGFATLAGINLYLTVFATGLAVRLGWIVLAPQYEQLAILSDPVILAIAGGLFLIEFFADKVPWVDSLWDSVHTIIRPVGAAFLAITVLGEVNPVFDVIIGLLGGGMALTTHALKSGSRLVVNASPEPFSNIVVSIGEDLAVLGGVALVLFHPLVMFGLALIACGLAIWLLPQIFRRAKATLWFLWRRIAFWFGSANAPDHSRQLPPELDQAFAAARGVDAKVRWFAPCVTGRVAGVPTCSNGWILFTDSDSHNVEFAIEKGGKVQLIPLGDSESKLVHSAGFLCDRLAVYKRDERVRHVVQFDRSRRSRVLELLRMIEDDVSVSPPDNVTAGVKGV